MNLYDRLATSLQNAIEYETQATTLDEISNNNGLITCPHCGESYYQENYSTRTAVYYPPIYKNGVNINPDQNTTTTCCHCLNCGKDFSYQS